MPSVFYNNAKKLFLEGGLDLREAGDDLRVALVMENTTADTDTAVALMNGFTTLDEHDDPGGSTNYVRKVLAAQAVNQDNPNNRAEFDCDDITWTALGNGTRGLQGFVVYKHVTSDADSIPLFYVEFAAVQNPAGSDFVVQVDPEGLLQL